jgi:hypothetical protein
MTFEAGSKQGGDPLRSSVRAWQAQWLEKNSADHAFSWI